MLHHVLAFQSLDPCSEDALLRLAARSHLFRTAACDQLLRVLRSAQVRIHGELLAIGIDVQRAQEGAGDIEHGLETVGVALVVAEHYVVFGVQVIVASIFCEEQAIQEKVVASGGFFAEERTPHFAERLLLDLAQRLKQVLAHFAQDRFFRYLELREALAHSVRFIGMWLARSLHVLELGAAALDHLVELQRHFIAQELDNRQARHQVDGDVGI